MSYFVGPVREIMTEDKLTLVDRMYQPGDLLKRSVDDVRSGIVTKCVVRCAPLRTGSTTRVTVMLMGGFDRGPAAQP